MNYEIINGNAVIPEGTKTLGVGAFDGCTCLTDVTKAKILRININAM